ncbi:ribonuclease P protein subunit p14 [Leptonychotes weddellii]|uniref:Ribonuclease P protein subunit p14 n=1 Tax=Leptonychotes weddellii TaxID=9713 RepID=A0A2U3YWC5_LEPWE|nr:ribonuclease P protein subunit p14 [Leptonychotes weddellii]
MVVFMLSPVGDAKKNVALLMKAGVDAALPLDILTYEEKTLSAILRICSSGLVKLWSSLTLLGSYKGKKCAFRVIQVSPFLLALSGNSRELVLD